MSLFLCFCSVKLNARTANMVCNARRVAIVRMAERATPLTVPAHVLTAGKASIVEKGVAKTPPHTDPIVLSSVLVTGTTLSCKCLFLFPYSVLISVAIIVVVNQFLKYRAL